MNDFENPYRSPPELKSDGFKHPFGAGTEVGPTLDRAARESARARPWLLALVGILAVLVVIFVPISIISLLQFPAAGGIMIAVTGVLVALLIGLWRVRRGVLELDRRHDVTAFTAFVVRMRTMFVITTVVLGLIAMVQAISLVSGLIMFSR